MKMITAILSLLLTGSTQIFADQIFLAVAPGGMVGQSTSLENGKFIVSSDGMKAKLSFRIDSVEPNNLILESDRTGFPLYTEKLVIVNSTENLVQAVGIYAESIMVYTLLKKEGTVYYSNQRAVYNNKFPSLVSAMWGNLTILVDLVQ